MTLPLEKQVTSLELSRRLEELGVKQKSLFYWGVSSYQSGSWVKFWGDKAPQPRKWMKYFSAYTVAELGEMFPDKYFNCYKNSECWLFSSPEVHTDIQNPKEADARALMICYLLENHLINLNSL